ncbi:TetR/AcrR family transcriptional regulator [Saccharospirillum mangrovi]|uniref:TetR/AcrR family transcriptional regulator n=1 Tax=Saccharospirillum mangrovi TaxID=2161747 RepID=UPI000D34ECE4|nr:TetR/AcrR family transcriptional regulator [Saccharospirillum mangrovi]
MEKAESSRLSQLLITALDVFARQGYRKTSMEDIARSAGISRQGLYLHFKNKDEVFSAAVRKSLNDGLTATQHVLAESQLGLEEKLLRVLDEWFGRHVGLLQPDASDLAVHCERLLGDLVFQQNSVFQEILQQTMMAASADNKTSRDQAATAAEMLSACALTWKHTLTSRQEFLNKLESSIALCCRNL